MSAAEVETENIEKNALGIEYSAACSIGIKLKDAREYSSISIEQLAKRAKIRERYIDAIEAGDWDILPPGLNGRGLIRLYAKELGVALPEFDEFSNLQTVQAEKQSEHLSHGMQTKKSRYQPAAEESAEVIKIVPRSQYRKNNQEIHNSSNSSIHNYDNEYTRTSINPKSNISRTHHTASIVTPNISDVLGIDIPTLSPGNLHKANDNNIENKKEENSNVHLLPVTKVNPKRDVTQGKVNAKAGAMPEEINAIIESTATLPEPKTQAKITKDEISESIFKKNFKNAILSIFAIITIILAGYTIHIVNRKEHKLESQPISNIESNLLQTNIQTNTANQITIQENLNKVINTPLKTPAPEANTFLPPVERSAKIDIIAKVKIQVDVDGKEIYAGYRQPGTMEFNFKNKAEILVYDASKVKLTYGAWDHGDLGWNERKRKIILNARPYEE